MAESSLPQAGPELLPTSGDLRFPAADRVVELGALLEELDRAAPAPAVAPCVLGPQVDNQLVQVRLGIASSLFAALRCRYPDAANHSLRVALSCSAWALKLGLPPHERDVLEVAALLHDVGCIGVPDQVLLKPGPLAPDELRIIEQSRKTSLEILRSACAEPAILQTVEHVAAWYDGSKGGYRLSGEEIPVGARILSIVEAFDAMTSDHVFRRAMSQERGIRELFDSAGTQFDPGLVRQFVELQVCDQSELRREVAGRWLRALAPEMADSCWELSGAPAAPAGGEAANLFEARLLDNMHDAVVFIDAGRRIVSWNHGAERLTGITASSICHRSWSPTLLNIQNEKGEWIGDEDCPVACSLRSKTQSLRRLTIAGRGGKLVSVDSHVIPVVAEEGVALGAILLLHDASPETSLEERCQNLHEKATRDSLTQVANRAEFDRVHEMFVNAHKQQRIPCSLIICDLDHFKLVNDTYGHPAGDEVIKSLTTILKDSCRPGDLVARYGGEEFVLLCADCDNAAATRRAEQVRKRFSQLPQSKLDGRTVTASFGVTEVQAGDTAETMLRRADRALLLAKQKGRNRVMQLGVGSETDKPERTGGWWFGKTDHKPLVLEQTLVTPVPIGVAIEKLRGFIADHCAKILTIDGDQVQVQIDGNCQEPLRRASDRPIAFCVQMRFEEERVEKTDAHSPHPITISRTRVHVSVSPRKSRDRRRADLEVRGREVLTSLRSYLMASVDDAAAADGMLRRAVRILTPWLLKR